MPGIVFVSVEDLAREGFTNGLFLQVRELTKRAIARGRQASFVCIAQRDIPVAEHRIRTVRGCTVHETFVPVAGSASAYRRALRELLVLLDPEVILLNSCAVRLTAAHHVVLNESLASGRHVVVLVTDQLYPTRRDHPANTVRGYYDLMRQASVYAVSETVARAFQRESGVPTRVLPNILSELRDRPMRPDEDGRFLTLINHHPIKGRRVWDALVLQRPDDAFLVVETWPDVPPYTPPSTNVREASFASDPTVIYDRTRVLLIPSLGPEGLPRVALEAMASGVPVIAHRIGSLPELGNAAVFVTPPLISGYELDEHDVLHPVVAQDDVERAARDFDNAVDAIDHDSAHRARLVANGRALVREYSRHSEAVARELLDAWFGTV